MIKFEQWKETADIDELWKEFMDEKKEELEERISKKEIEKLDIEWNDLPDDDFDDFLFDRYESELDSYYDEKYEMSKEEL